MNDRKTIASLVIALAFSGSLAGCVSSHSLRKPIVPAKHKAMATAKSLVESSIAKQKQKKLLPTSCRAYPQGMACFQAAASKLQELGYLVLTPGQIHEKTIIPWYAFRFSVPSSLETEANKYSWNWNNPFVRGAMVQFERQNGILHPQGVSFGRVHLPVLRVLFSTKAKKDSVPWEWVLVDKYDGSHHPEELHLWRQGKGWIWKTVVNTGVLGSTPEGTWPVYQRLPSTTMQGVFPIPVSWAEYHALAGQKVPQWAGSTLLQSARGMVHGHPVRWQPYKDPGILWVNYFDDGRGIHYYPRASYGFPQSAGCVEEPYQNAPITYKLLHYGVPVSVVRNVMGKI